MARNEEKLFGRLNRLYLQKQQNQELEKNPRRPSLNCLKSAAEIRKWLPTISRDLDIALKKIAVPCYPERVISDVNEQIARLEKDYRAFSRKLLELEQAATHVVTTTGATITDTKSCSTNRKRPHDWSQNEEDHDKSDKRYLTPNESVSQTSQQPAELCSTQETSTNNSSASSASSKANSDCLLSSRIKLAILSDDESVEHCKQTKPPLDLTCNLDTLDSPLDIRLPMAKRCCNDSQHPEQSCGLLANSNCIGALGLLSSSYDEMSDHDTEDW